jgi:hypothetical protein
MIEVDITGGEELLEAAAGDAGTNVQAYIQALVTKEITRLYHIERSRPRERKPVGRPALGVEQKQVRELGRDLLGVYLKLRELHGADYEAAFGAQQREVEAAMESGDLETLMFYHAEQPWVRRG